MAISDSELLQIDQETLCSLVNSCHAVARNLLLILTRKVRQDNTAINKLMLQQLHLEQVANIDGLTGLHYRRWLDDFFPRAVHRAQRSEQAVSIMMADLDYLKNTIRFTLVPYSLGLEVCDMLVEINFLENGIGILFVSSGVVTGEEIVEANEKIYTRENLLRLKYKIIDRTGCTEYRVTSDEIQAIANQDKKAAKINPNINVALVSTTPVQVGMSRMWQIYTDGIGFKTEIFEDLESALTWLKQLNEELDQDLKQDF